jgi:hypothetical protein
MNKIYLILALIIILFIYACMTSKIEKFTLVMSNEEIIALKQNILQNITSNEIISSSVIAHLEESQKEPVTDRLNKFKQLMVTLPFSQDIIELLYFDLRMNDSAEVRDRLVKGYSTISSMMVKNESEMPNPNQSLQNQLMIRIIQDWGKNGQFTVAHDKLLEGL